MHAVRLDTRLRFGVSRVKLATWVAVCSPNQAPSLLTWIEAVTSCSFFETNHFWSSCWSDILAFWSCHHFLIKSCSHSKSLHCCLLTTSIKELAPSHLRLWAYSLWNIPPLTPSLSFWTIGDFFVCLLCNIIFSVQAGETHPPTPKQPSLPKPKELYL